MSNDDNHSSADYSNDAPPPEYYAAKKPRTDAENSFPMILSVWWSFTWRSTLILIVSTIIVSMLLGFAVGIENMELYMNFIMPFIAIPVSIWSIGKALSVKHKKHRIIFEREE